MARHPEVFVRDLSAAEGHKLVRITRTAKDPVKLRRAIVVLMSAQGQAVGDIVNLLRCDDGYARDVIHAFNAEGFTALDPKWSGRRPPTVDETARGEGVQRPRVRREDAPHPGPLRPSAADGRVICADEFGPLNLLPRKGKAWRPAGRPARLRATYTRHGGVRHMLAALDLATGKMTYRIRARKRRGEFLELLKVLRRKYANGRLYLIVDNFSPRLHTDVTAWCDDNNIELVFLPTNASWLNWIEAEFAALRYFALNGTDHRSHDEQGKAIKAYMVWRNAHAEPKRGFAINSKIRSPDYRANVPC
jgi:transposase